MVTTIRYVLLTAIRDWLFVGLFIAICLAIGISTFLGNTALVEEGQMTTSYVAASVRVILVVGLITFVCFHVRRAFDNREIDVMISRPISREAFVFAYWLGFVLVALLLYIPVMAVMWVLLPVGLSGLVYWGISMLLEIALVLAFALFAALILRSAVSSVLFSFGFYLISRMMGFFLFIMDAPHIFNNVDLNWVTGKLLVAISAILPRLDLFAKSKWLIYSIENDMSYMWFVPQTLIYVPLLLLAAVIDFKRKQF